jgi:hypothetical protein
MVNSTSNPQSEIRNPQSKGWMQDAGNKTFEVFHTMADQYQICKHNLINRQDSLILVNLGNFL